MQCWHQVDLGLLINRNLSVLLLICFSVTSFAQQPAEIELIQQQSDRLYRQQKQERETELRKREEQQKRSIIEFGLKPEVQLPRKQGARCFNIGKIKINGVRPVFLKDIYLITNHFERQCLALSDINSLLKSITGYYLQKGYITSRAYLPQQNLLKKILTIKVVEGIVESFDNSKAPHINIHTAFPDMTGSILNLRDIEQGLERLNRLQSNQAHLDLTPGKSVGTTVIQLKNNRQRPWQAYYRIDNSGQKNTGEQQHKIYTSLDNLLGLNDYISLSLNTDNKKDSQGKKSQSLNIRYEVPLGYWLFALDANWTRYLNRITGQSTIFDSSGKNNQQTLTTSRVIQRNKISKTELIGKLIRKSGKNYIEDVLLNSSSRTLGIAKLVLHYQHFYTGDRKLSLEAGYQQGVSLFGSPDKENSDAPNPKYRALLFDLSFNTPFRALRSTFNYSLQISAQYSEDILFGTEKFSIGGQYSVRGFKQESLAGRSGIFWRNEFSHTLNLKKHRLGIKTLIPFIGVDAGAIQSEPDSSQGSHLSGLSLGFKALGNKVDADITWSLPLKQPDSFSLHTKQVYFSVTYKF